MQRNEMTPSMALIRLVVDTKTRLSYLHRTEEIHSFTIWKWVRAASESDGY